MTRKGRYHEILGYRREGLRKYGGRLTSDIYGPPFALAFPMLHRAPPPRPWVKMGPFYVADNPPALRVAERAIEQMDAPVRILEIGPGDGSFAKSLRARFAEKIAAYYGLEPDESVRGSYTRLASVHDAPQDIDLVIASEVIEHMTPESFFDDLLGPLRSHLSAGCELIVGTPNALSPSSIFGDFTHVQGYAWYDLYALLRLFFERVDVLRTRSVWSAQRLFSLPARVVLAKALELDWCEGVVCRATGLLS
ncbi:MAG: class I SAM-dependent methyltransferase [Candidatus Tyrphobacter sp.]